MSSNNESSIHQFDYSLICEYFASMLRQGPGSEETTLQALSFVKGLTEQTVIADLGCGTGSQTITLAKHSPCHIQALDLFPDFINQLNNTIQQEGLQKRIECHVGDMGHLPFEDNSINIIWCEGAIYNIGFRHGLNQWRRFLQPNGYIVVSEAVWLTPEHPAEIEDFWLEAYPEIDTIPAKLSILQEEGYRPVAMFVLPDNCWTDNFYTPAVQAQEIFLSKHRGNATAQDLVTNQRHEAELFRLYHRHYGYAFFIGQKL